MTLNRFLAVCMLSLSSTAMADALDINLNDRAAQISYASSAGLNLQGNAEVHFGLLYNDQKNNFADAGLLVKGEEEAVPGLSVGVGAKAVYSSIGGLVVSKKTAGAVAIGMELGYALPTVKHIGIVADAYLSPKILTFADGERFSQGGVRLEYGISPLTMVYLAYRQIHFGLKNNIGDTKVDDGAVFGVKISF